MCKPRPGDEICELCLDYSLAHCEECEYREKRNSLAVYDKERMNDYNGK